MLTTPAPHHSFTIKFSTMKCSFFTAMPLLAVVLLGIASCGGQENKNASKTTTATDTTTSSTATTATTPATSTKASAVVTRPQNIMEVMHKVANFNKWQMSYDAHDSMRLASGVHSYVIGRGLKDSNMIMVAVKVDDLNKAKAFEKETSLKQAMQKGGVLGQPQMHLVTMVYQDTVTINTDLRSRTTFRVKDWNKWQHIFDSSRQQRIDNGIIDRAYGHDADDNHKITIIVALTDTAKAYAFWKSDQLKKMQAQSGMIGSPERFIYRMVKRY